MLELEGITKRYQGPRGTVCALEGVSLSLNPGNFTAVVGPSGCGKTTLLLTAGGLLAPTEGKVEVEGKPIYSLSPDERARFRASHIGFVFQQFHLIPYLSVLENVLTVTLAERKPDAETRARELLERFGMAPRSWHLPEQLSTGERQRTALARALLNKPKVILADEPTGNLDEENTRLVLSALAEFSQEGGIVLLVTHDRTVAQYAQQTVRLEGGKLCEQ